MKGKRDKPLLLWDGKGCKFTTVVYVNCCNWNFDADESNVSWNTDQ